MDEPLKEQYRLGQCSKKCSLLGGSDQTCSIVLPSERGWILLVARKWWQDHS